MKLLEMLLVKVRDPQPLNSISNTIGIGLNLFDSFGLASMEPQKNRIVKNKSRSINLDYQT